MVESAGYVRAERIVDAILNNLMGRRGLSDEWDMIEHDIRDEIRADWIDVVREFVDV